MAAAVVFLFPVFSCRLPAAPVPGRVPLRQARHLVVVAADPEHPVFFLVGCALPQQVLHHLAEAPVDEIPMADLRRVARVRLRQQEAACRTADAQVLARDSAAGSVLAHLARHLALRLGVPPPVDHVLVGTVVHARKLAAAENSLLLPDDLPHQDPEIARRVCRGLGHARTVQAKDLHAVRLQAVSSPDELDRLVCLLRMAEATRVPHLHRVLPLLRDEDVLRPYPFRARTVRAKRLTRAALLHPALRVPVCREDRAKLQCHQQARPRALCRRQAPGYLPHAQRHALAAARSLDSQF